MKREKGNKILSLVLFARRWWKYGLCCAYTFLVITRWNVDLVTESQSLRGRIARANAALRPVETRPNTETWELLSRDEIMTDLQCDYQEEREIHDPDVWIGMREAYISVVGEDQATVELDASRTFETAFQVPFEVRQSPGMGRGLFALEDISKGMIMYDFSQSAQFRNEFEFKEFLRILKPDLACDVLMWSYVQGFENGSRIVTDLDPGSFCNDGHLTKTNMAWLGPLGDIAWEREEDFPDDAKIVRNDGLVRQDAVKSAPLVATKNIQKGDELFCFYSQFSQGMGKMFE